MNDWIDDKIARGNVLEHLQGRISEDSIDWIHVAVEQRDKALAQVDRLAQALADTNPFAPNSDGYMRCTHCGVMSVAHGGMGHAKICPYVWATKHVAALEAAQA